MALGTEGGGGRSAPEALEALAEALVLVDPRERPTLEVLLGAVRDLAEAAPSGDVGDVVREAMGLAEAAVGRLTSGESDDAAAELAIAAEAFERARASLSDAPGLERSRAGARAEVGDEPVGETPAPRNALAEDAELVGDFVTRSQEHLDSADTLLLLLEQTPDDRDVLDATFRVFHTIKGMAGFLGFTEIEQFAHDTESFLDGPRKGKGVFTPEAFDAVFEAVDVLRELVAKHSGDGEDASRPARVDAGTAFPGDASASGDKAGGGVSGGVGQPVRSAETATRRSSENTVRVDEERLDLLLDTIGELVIAEAMVSEATRADSDAWNAVGEKFSRLDKITRELQEMATSLRMMPLKGTFGRMARLVRDLGLKAGKKIELVTEGEETELDKAMVDLLADPLMHLLRNAVDHGLETPKERRAAGKRDTGRLSLRAYHAGGSVCVEVEDDGRGLDTDAIFAKAVRQGLVESDAALSPREIHDLIFVAGFSTAQEVTDVSGRGVGMDVVKRAVEGLRGVVEVNSTRGQGSRFVLRMPLTLAIIDGMVVRVGHERYILPTQMIQRSLRPECEELYSVLGRAEMLSTDEGMVPLVRLGRLFEVPDADPDPAEGIVVLVGENGDRAGLVASELLGQQQTVIKPLGEIVSNAPGVSGGAIMPDGTVGLILDVSGLIRLAHKEGGE